MKKTVKISFTLDELQELTGLCSEYGHHLNHLACKKALSNYPSTLDKHAARAFEFSARFYQALNEATFKKGV